MKRYYYSKGHAITSKIIVRFVAFAFVLAGSVIFLYVFFPFVSWHIYFTPIFAASELVSPIPKTTIVNSSSIQSLLASGIQSLSGVDYTNARNWFPEVAFPKNGASPKISSYHLSIPSIQIADAIVSTNDYNLATHLINYPGTPVPSENGNAVIFGHSTLPQLYNPKDYKTIFANAYKITVDDTIIVIIEDVVYTYKVYSITVVDPTDTSFFTQSYDTSYLTLVTCTPPGTTWKRLIVKARLVPLSDS